MSTAVPAAPLTLGPAPAYRPPPRVREIQSVPLIRDSVTFADRQALRVKEIERRMADELRHREKQWQRSVERMREDFLHLYPCSNASLTGVRDTAHPSGDAGARSAPAPPGAPPGDPGPLPVPPGAEGVQPVGVAQAPDLDPRVARRRGSTDVLDVRKMKTLFFDYPPLEGGAASGAPIGWAGPQGALLDVQGRVELEGGGTPAPGERNIATSNGAPLGGASETGRRFQLRFDVAGFHAPSIRVTTDGARIIVRASRLPDQSEPGGVAAALEGGVSQRLTANQSAAVEYYRKIQKPKEVDQEKLTAYLTADAVLVIEAPVPPAPPKPPRGAPGSKECAAGSKMSHSASHSSHDSNISRTSSHDSAGGAGGAEGAAGGSNSPGTPGGGGAAKEKIGVPIFRDENGTRRMHLTVDLGAVFEPDDVIVQVIKENKIQIRAKHRVKTPERLSKSKFNKEYELGEKIETYSLKGGLTGEGRLIVNAFAKGHGEAEEAPAPS